MKQHSYYWDNFFQELVRDDDLDKEQPPERYMLVIPLSGSYSTMVFMVQKREMYGQRIGFSYTERTEREGRFTDELKGLLAMHGLELKDIVWPAMEWHIPEERLASLAKRCGYKYPLEQKRKGENE